MNELPKVADIKDIIASIDESVEEAKKDLLKYTHNILRADRVIVKLSILQGNRVSYLFILDTIKKVSNLKDFEKILKIKLNSVLIASSFNSTSIMYNTLEHFHKEGQVEVLKDYLLYD